MPEEVVRRLICDYPHNRATVGKRYTIDDGRRLMAVILCPLHAAPLEEMAARGALAPRASASRSIGERGLSDQRLDRLIRAE